MSRTTSESRKEGSSLAGRVCQLAFVAWILLVNLMDPAQVQAPDAMLELLTNLNVRWIVKTREYPEDLARPLWHSNNKGNFCRLLQRTSKIVRVREESTMKRKSSAWSCSELQKETKSDLAEHKKTRPAGEAGLPGRKLHSQCADGHRILSSSAV